MRPLDAGRRRRRSLTVTSPRAEASLSVPDILPSCRHEFPGGTVLVCPRPEAELLAASRIADLVRSRTVEGGRVVLGLATGSTPIAVYDHLAAWHEAGQLSFGRVTTYNLDEYYPMSPADPRSYRAFMDRHLFHRVNLAANQTHLLDGTVPAAHTGEHCHDFERWIAADGGLDLQLLGLGRNGHIGFNEPADLPTDQALALPTRVVALHPTTRADAMKDFGAEANVPHHALTMGIAAILAARSILVLAFGSGKADAVAQSLVGPISARVPGSLLQTVSSQVTWLVDPAAASRLF